MLAQHGRGGGHFLKVIIVDVPASNNLLSSILISKGMPNTFVLVSAMQEDIDIKDYEARLTSHTADQGYARTKASTGQEEDF